MGRAVDYTAEMFGREAELSRIEGFLDDVSRRPKALLIEGAVGIGKTTLWTAGMDVARHRGCWVLTCRPVQSEAPLTFSALGDLFEPVPQTALAGLPGPQRHALDVALLRAGPGPDPPDQRAVAVAVLGVIRALASTAPVVVGSMTCLGLIRLRPRSSSTRCAGSRLSRQGCWLRRCRGRPPARPRS